MTQTQFEDRLLAELRRVVAERPAPEAVALPRPRRRRRLLLAGTATAAAAAAAVLFAIGSDRVTPAFAVDRQADGDVTVTINDLSDARGLQSKLRADGINAVVNYTPAGKACEEPRGRPAASHDGPSMSSVQGSSVRGSDHSATFTISRNMVGPGQTLVISTSGGGGPTSVGMQVVEGPVSPCVLVNAPAAPPGAVTSSHWSKDGRSAGPQTSGPQTSGPQTSRVP
jgi:hypothetical protein